MKKYLCILAAVLVATAFSGQRAFAQDETTKHPPCNESEIPNYTAFKTAVKPEIDGCLDETIWQIAPISPPFRDLISGRETIHDTRAALLWDDEYLYIAYWVEEPDLQATLTERDAPIYMNNDVEWFIAGSDGYYEFEINSFGTIYEVLFLWDEAYKAGGYDKVPGLELDAPGAKPFNGVGYTTHPRGMRTGWFHWDLPGLKTAVCLDGTINDSSDRDRGWTVELAIPWKGLEILTHRDKRSLPPKDQDMWQMDFSRFNQYKEAPPAEDNGGWAWSPHGVWDSHVPECFTRIHFSTDEVTPQ